MNGGVKAALLVSCLGLAGCATSTKEVKVQAIPDPAAALARGGDLTAVARGQLMLGNVGLAIEGFRKAQRANPTDAAPLAGIGDCYAAMGRLDIAQSSYEAALALAPHDPRLLLALAAIFDAEGQPLRAAAARADADRVSQPAAPAKALASASPAKAAPTPAATTATPEAASVPAVMPPQASRPVELAQSAAPQASGRATPVAPAATPAAPKRAEAAAPTVAEQLPNPIHASTGSITVELPPARPATRVEARVTPPPMPPIEVSRRLSSSVTLALPPARPAPRPAAGDERLAAVVESSGPRLERLSRGEVALVTTDKPIWRAAGETRTASATGLRWMALLPAADGRTNVQVLNAARTQGIAGSARTVLLNRGWRRIEVGDAPATRQKSVVLYSRNRAKLGKSLAAQFGVAARMVERDILVLVLGRDAIDRVSGQRKS